jgi:hypothetical protein
VNVLVMNPARVPDSFGGRCKPHAGYVLPKGSIAHRQRSEHLRALGPDELHMSQQLQAGTVRIIHEEERNPIALHEIADRNVYSLDRVMRFHHR